MKKTLSLTILAGMLTIGAHGAWAATQGPYPTALTDGAFGPSGSITPSTNTKEIDLYNAINLLMANTATPTSYSNNSQIDSLEYTGPGNTATWEQTGTGGYAVIGLGAGNANTMEVYNAASPGTLISPMGGSFSGNGFTGNGTISSPYAGSSAVFSSGTFFGFALNTVGVSSMSGGSTPSGGNTWYSNPTLNSDLMDHIIVYNLTALNGSQIYIETPGSSTEQLVTLDNPYLVGFEDLPLNANGVNSDMDYNDLMFLVSGASPDAPAPVPEPTTLGLFGAGLLSMAGIAAAAI